VKVEKIVIDKFEAKRKLDAYRLLAENYPDHVWEVH
jgi:hypothetical protein